MTVENRWTCPRCFTSNPEAEAVCPRCGGKPRAPEAPLTSEALELSEREDTACDAALVALHDRIALALQGNESWKAISETAVELIGTSRVRLEGGQASD